MHVLKRRGESFENKDGVKPDVITGGGGGGGEPYVVIKTHANKNLDLNKIPYLHKNNRSYFDQ